MLKCKSENKINKNSSSKKRKKFRNIKANYFFSISKYKGKLLINRNIAQ